VPAADHQPEFAERAKLFGEKVRQRRNELGLTERELIELTGLSRGYIQLLLNNRGGHKDPKTGTYKPVNPTLDVIWRLADALQLDPSYLVDNERGVEAEVSSG
jgi:transcriptional regulator with XRE-family HTH domain